MIAAPCRRRRVVACVALVAAASLLPGCLVLPCFTSVRTGALLPRDRVEALKPGATTAAQVLEWLGPPLAIARDPAGVVQVPDVGFRRSGANAVPAASFFEKFSAGAAAPGDVVYFYRAHEVATPGAGAYVIIGDRGTLVGDSRDEERDERLWILLDGASGVVKACVHERDEPPPPEDPPAPRPGEETA